MEKYREILMYTISIISKIYLVYVVVLVLALIFSIIIKAKKVRNATLGLLICTVIIYTVLVVPRFYDLQNDSFIKVENAKIKLNDMYTVSTNIMFFGHAEIIQFNGKTIEVSGTDFIEIPPSESDKEYYKNVVYAKHSRQLIAIEFS